MKRRAALALEALAVAAILLVAGWLRVHELERYMVADELRWTCRSISFHIALAEADWAKTFQVGHPGVVTMWLGALALPLEHVGRWRELCPLTDGGRDLSKLDDVGQEGLLQSVEPLLMAARRGIVAGSLVALVALYLLLRGAARLGAPAAIAGWGLLALDPYLLAHSKVLHLDAMLALLSLAAVVALSAAKRPGRKGLAGAGLAGGLAGLAMLAKVTGLVLGPFVLAWFAWRGRRSGEWRGALAGFLVWGLAAALVYTVLWPSMWVDPVGTVGQVLAKAEEEGASPHESGNYFLGRPVDDPGPAFYPVAGAFRLTPWVLLGLAAVAGWLVWLAWRWGRRRRTGAGPPPGAGDDAPARALVVRLLVWALFFGLVMTFGPKKFDRYLLPALAAVDVAVGAGLVTLLGLAWRGRPSPAWAAGAAAALLVGLQALAGARSLPYPMAYYNPLLGGAPAAARALLVGWGEGYDLAADWLNAQPGADTLEASARSQTVFGPRFEGRSRSAEGYRPGRSDYVVLYVSQVQRRQNDDLVAAYQDGAGTAPAFVGRIAGLDYVWVYPNASLAPLRAALDRLARPGDVLVTDGDGVLARGYDGPLAVVPYWGHWGEPEMREALDRDFPDGWRRAWVVRYPGQDSEVAEQVLGGVARRTVSETLAGGAVTVTGFER
jgi:4-amino-4-deoxy-L-arabinose transferase-like glycosyltransferase